MKAEKQTNKPKIIYTLNKISYLRTPFEHSKHTDWNFSCITAYRN